MKESPRPSPNIRSPMRERIQGSLRLLHQAKIRIRPQPCPVAVYFTCVCREPIGAVYSALFHSLPSRLLFGICFIGSSIPKRVTGTSEEARLVANTKVLGISAMQNYNIFRNDYQKASACLGTDTTWKEAAQQILRRMEVCFRSCKIPAATEWCSTVHRNIEQSLRSRTVAQLSNQSVTTKSPFLYP